jgi:flagellar basal-body rod protein FlgG
MRNRDGDLVVTIGPGYELIPPINIPMAATNISIACDGKLQFTNAAGKAVTCGQIKLCRFMNPQGLRQLGGGIYTQTVISGPPVVNNPGDNGVGQVMQGFLESSNVDPIKEWAGMLKAEQSLQLNSQAMRTLDRARVALVNLKKS